MILEIPRIGYPQVVFVLCRRVCLFSVYNRKGYLWLRLTLWNDYRHNAPVLWRNHQMDFNGDSTFLRKFRT